MTSHSPVIALYVTGHGFGHAVRCATVATQLCARIPDLKVFVKTEAPQWLFRGIECAELCYLKQVVDASPIQVDAFTMDLPKTAEYVLQWFARKDKWIEDEAQWLKRTNAALVIADISPLALIAAHQAGVPSALVANFTWDWIYGNLGHTDSRFGPIAEELRPYSRLADWAFVPKPAAPPHWHVYPIPVDIVGRACPMSRAEARKHLGIHPSDRVVLLTFGGIGAGRFDFTRLNELENYRFLSTEPRPGLNNCIVYQPWDVDHACLVNAADIIVGKLGYGTVAEALIHGTPVLYSPREDWPEGLVLREAIRTSLPSISMPREQFEQCLWEQSLGELAKAKRPERQPGYGAVQIASMLAAFLQDPKSISPGYYPAQDELSNARRRIFS